MLDGFATPEELGMSRDDYIKSVQKSNERIRKMKDLTHEEMLEEATRRELANKSFDELTKDQRIQLALEEVDWIVIGGQDGEEFYGSIQFIRKVLRSLK
jgi:hypothetical protein